MSRSVSSSGRSASALHRGITTGASAICPRTRISFSAAAVPSITIDVLRCAAVAIQGVQIMDAPHQPPAAQPRPGGTAEPPERDASCGPRHGADMTLDLQPSSPVGIGNRCAVRVPGERCGRRCLGCPSPTPGSGAYKRRGIVGSSKTFGWRGMGRSRAGVAEHLPGPVGPL